MKIDEVVGNVTLGGSYGQVKNFRIKVNEQSFKLLYRDLYPDRNLAIIRELSTNAADSHIAAGKANLPFEVHLPNSLEPYFYVKDFGTGMSPKQIDDIYIECFNSNKTESND